MKGYRELVTAEDLEAFLDCVGGFHDGLVKEVRIVDRAFVDAGRTMHASFRLDARIVVQIQGNVPAFELLAVDVRTLSMGTAEVSSAGGIRRTEVAGPVPRTEYVLRIDDTFRLACGRLFFAERPEWVGPAARLHDEVPAPDAVLARDLGHDCRQCSSCAAPFEVATCDEYAWCPGCGRLTLREPA